MNPSKHREPTDGDWTDPTYYELDNKTIAEVQGIIAGLEDQHQPPVDEFDEGWIQALETLTMKLQEVKDDT